MPGKRPPKEARHKYQGRLMLMDNTLKRAKEEPAHEKTMIGMYSA
jgi:hypothetical protein